MQFHHHGYVSHDPRVKPAAGIGIDRPADLPDEMDVLIVGSGPAGMLAAAQLAQFPHINTRIIERRPGRLEVGQADGIQARSVETFQAFGFAERITAEAYQITEMAFWNPDPDQPENIIRTSVPIDDPSGVSEFPHLIVNQARVLDYFAEAAHNAPGRITPDYGYQYLDYTRDDSDAYPLRARLRHSAGEREGQERTVKAKYIVGCDGAHSAVRKSIGRVHQGDESMQAWGVMDVLAVTDFPDIRTKCAIQSEHGSILHIPREGQYLFRMYVDLGELAEDDNHQIRKTTVEETIAKANAILHPYTLDVRHVAWYTVYEVAHRLTDHFDEVADTDIGRVAPRIFITGDACHTHSAEAGQGMNVSLQDGWNISWKLGHVLSGLAPQSLLSTYSAERQVVAKELIDFDKEWATMMAQKPEDFDDPNELADFYVKTAEFPAGFMTEYAPSMIVGTAAHQDLAPDYPIGKRFKSAGVYRVCDGNPVELGHHARADGRWRIYAFADGAAPGEDSPLRRWADWLCSDSQSPVVKYTPAGADLDAVFDAKVIYQQPHAEVEFPDVPAIFQPRVGPFNLIDYEKVYAIDPANDIFASLDIDRRGAVVIVRPDQYVSHVLPLNDTDALARFLDGAMATHAEESLKPA